MELAFDPTPKQSLDELKFRLQVPVGPYIADFVCKELKLIVEVDGGQHATVAHDRKRDEWLIAHGWRVLRLWNNHVLDDTESALEHMRIAAAGGMVPD